MLQAAIIILRVLWLASVIITLWYMLKVRHAGAQNPAIEDGLTVGERALTIFTILFGGVILTGTIYYYGWKKRFPRKARSILWIEGTFLVLLFVMFFGGGYLYQQYVLIPQAQTQAQNVLSQIEQQQQQQLQQQQSSLASNSSQTYQGNGFSISVPSGWSEDTTAESQWASFGQSKVWHTLSYTLTGGANNASQELDVVWNTDTPTGQLNQSETTEVNGDANFPSQYIITHPSIQGASSVVMITPTTVGSDSYSIKLYAHAGGKIYFVEGSLTNGTTAQADGLKQIIQSFKLSQTTTTQNNPAKNNVPTAQTPPSPIQSSTGYTNTSPSATIDKSSLYSNSSTFTVTGTASNLTSVLVEFNGNGSGNGGGTYPVVSGRWTATLTGVSGNMGVVVYPPSGQGTVLASGRFVYTQ